MLRGELYEEEKTSIKDRISEAKNRIVNEEILLKGEIEASKTLKDRSHFFLFTFL